MRVAEFVSASPTLEQCVCVARVLVQHECCASSFHMCVGATCRHICCTCEETAKPWPGLTKAAGATPMAKMEISGPWPPHPDSCPDWSGPALGAVAPQASIPGTPTPRGDDDGAEGGQAGAHSVPEPPAAVDPKAAAPFGAIHASRQVATGPHMCLIIIG